MLRFLFWVIAIAFCVGAGAIIFACGDDDDENDSSAVGDDSVPDDDGDDSVDDDTTGDDDDVEPTPPEGWRMEIIGEGEYHNNDFAVDSQARPHLVYGNTEELFYGTREEAGWGKNPLKSSERDLEYPSLALDGEEMPHVSVAECEISGGEHQCSLLYGSATAGEWSFETVETFPHRYVHTDMCVYADGNAVIANETQYSYKTDLWTNAGGAWSNLDALPAQNISLSCADGPDLATAGCITDISDPPDWYDGVGGYLFERPDDGWQGGFAFPIEGVLEIDDTHLMRANDGSFHIMTTFRVEPDVTYSILYFTDRSGSWQKEEIASFQLEATRSGLHTSVLDSQDRPHILFWDFNAHEYRHLIKDDAEWREESLELSAGIESFKLDADDYIHILFRYHLDGSDYRLYYLTNRPEQ